MKVRYYGHHHLPSGYGQAAWNLAMALDRAGAQVQVRTIGAPDPNYIGSLPPDMLEDQGIPDAIIVHTLPGDCHRVLQLEGLERGAGPKLIAYTTWEALTAPPDVLMHLYANFDQVWVPSGANAAAFRFHGMTPRVVPHCFNPEEYPAPIARPEGDRFRFYWMGAWSARKNPGGLIRAFALAFNATDPVELVVHSPGVTIDTFVHAMASTGIEQAQLPAMTLSNKHLEDSSIAKMHATYDCFVSAARGEAWNLPAFDAMLLGRHVITQYGLGSDDFLSDTSADLVDGMEAPAQVDITVTKTSSGDISMRRVGAQGLTARCLWLEPNLSSMAEAMRSAVVNQKRDIKISYDVAEHFGYATVANHVLKMLET